MFLLLLLPVIPVSVKKNFFQVSFCCAVRRQKLLSSSWLGPWKACHNTVYCIIVLLYYCILYIVHCTLYIYIYIYIYIHVCLCSQGCFFSQAEYFFCTDTGSTAWNLEFDQTVSLCVSCTHQEIEARDRLFRATKIYYIYIYRERERDIHVSLSLSIYIYSIVHIYIYIYIYILYSV